MTIATWHPPVQNPPSPTRHGEPGTAPLHAAAGRALSQWEQTEAALIKLFQVVCETTSLAPCRAFGTIAGAPARSAAMTAAAEEFFRRRRAGGKLAIDMHEKALAALLKAYETAGACRNNIAHGAAAQPHGNGYFLCAPSFAGKKRQGAYQKQVWGSASAYFYKVDDIEHCTRRFIAIRDEAMRLAVALNVARRVLRTSQLEVQYGSHAHADG